MLMCDVISEDETRHNVGTQDSIRSGYKTQQGIQIYSEYEVCLWQGVGAPTPFY